MVVPVEDIIKLLSVGTIPSVENRTYWYARYIGIKTSIKPIPNYFYFFSQFNLGTTSEENSWTQQKQGHQQQARMSPATAGMLARAGMLATQGHIRKDATTAGTLGTKGKPSNNMDARNSWNASNSTDISNSRDTGNNAECRMLARAGAPATAGKTSSNRYA